MEVFQTGCDLAVSQVLIGYSLSYPDVEELALGRGLKVDHSTIDFMLSEKRDEPPARAFFLKVITF